MIYYIYCFAHLTHRCACHSLRSGGSRQAGLAVFKTTDSTGSSGEQARWGGGEGSETARGFPAAPALSKEIWALTRMATMTVIEMCKYFYKSQFATCTSFWPISGACTLGNALHKVDVALIAPKFELKYIPGDSNAQQENKSEMLLLALLDATDMSHG